MKQHTAQSLARYLGKKVLCKDPAYALKRESKTYTGKLLRVDYPSFLFIENDGMPFTPNWVFPILKPLLLDFNSGYWKFSPVGLETMMEEGFGAIPDSESPTGYVDLFGYPCEVEK